MNEIKCCNCGWQGTENDLAQFNDVGGGGYGCPNCNTDEYLLDLIE